MATTRVLVRAALAPGRLAGDLAPADAGVPGHYEVELTDRVAPEHFGTAAMDGFHSSVPVKNLDDFEFTVSAIDGGELARQQGAAEYLFQKEATVVSKREGPLQVVRLPQSPRSRG